ncbi:MAG: hypothetical protein WC326_09275 [Candidatus Delongbacteria bacterium]
MRTVFSWILGLGLLAGAGSAWALPRFAAQYGQSCHLCHVNPAGGGLRTSYGSQFFTGTELAAKGLAQEQLEELSPALSKRVEIGLDFRGMFLQESQSSDPATALAKHERSSFFLMQGDIYLGLKLHEKVRVVLEKSLNGTGEGYGLLSVLPWHGSVKAGRFLPNYGWNWVDHETAARRALGYGAGQLDTGVEVELHPDHYSLALAVGNDNAGPLDGDPGKALTLRVLWQHEALGGALSLGANARVSDHAPAPSRTLAGLLAGFSRGPLTWTAELNRFESADVAGLAFSQEWAWKLRPGLDLLYVHDFYDPDLDLKTGLDLRQRAGLDWIPVPGVALQPALSWLRHEEQSAADDWLQADLQLYLFL